MDQTQKQQVAEVRGEELFTRIMERVAHVLTEEDMKVIETLNTQDDEKGSLVQGYLKAKVPNFDVIMQEEIDAYKKHAS